MRRWLATFSSTRLNIYGVTTENTAAAIGDHISWVARTNLGLRS